ncbi:hypothetical protein [Zobellella sp. An-6]|uniref:hypothetical protein n=1 Tax=Zobellella sp. An-6 TaxID=3400218 RepID=UPI00404350ED
MSKHILIAAGLGLMLNLSPVLAEEAHHAPAEPAKPVDAATMMERQQQMGMMQERMQTMRDQMAALQQTQDPAERERLLAEHLEFMTQSMAQMEEHMAMCRQMMEHMGQMGMGQMQN